MGIVSGVELLNPYLLKVAIDRYIATKNLNGLLFLGLVMSITILVSMFCTRKRISLMAKITNQIHLTIRQELYAHLQKLSLSFFDHRPAGKILARVIGDVNSLNNLFNTSVTGLIPDLATIIAVIIIMLAMNYRLALASFLMLPVLIIFLGAVEIVSHRRWQIFRQKSSNLNAFTHEHFSGIKVVQSFTAEEQTKKDFHFLLRENFEAFIRAVRLNDLFWPSVELSWGIGTIIVFWYGTRLLNTGTVTIGLLVAFSGYVSMFWRPVMNISNFYNTLVSNLSGAERIYELMDIEPSIQEAEDAVTLPTLRGEVEFKDVTFGYQDGQIVLDQVSFRVAPGETVALVGPTGAGKTSIINLIGRFFQPQSGLILIDGFDLQKVTLESLRGQMGWVLQDTFLFSGRIIDNIRYGRLTATDEECIAAAKAVHAHEFITKLENGYDTEVQERGARLSFGQRQQIAFARALVANPRILILDEATAGIDTHTERLLQQGIARLLAGRTSFIIAHRLSTIVNADRIMLIDQGRIIEMGNHQELLHKKGYYYQLFMAQFRFLAAKEEPVTRLG
ncbi:MAG: ABC transporter ATP-binding protein [Firmicutes bacterium]|nr:ABC transporter ATP-binding protein [Bacillota bacterium]